MKELCSCPRAFFRDLEAVYSDKWPRIQLLVHPGLDGGAPPRASVLPGTDADAVRKLLPRKGVGETCYKLAFACKGNIF